MSQNRFQLLRCDSGVYALHLFDTKKSFVSHPVRRFIRYGKGAKQFRRKIQSVKTYLKCDMVVPVPKPGKADPLSDLFPDGKGLIRSGRKKHFKVDDPGGRVLLTDYLVTNGTTVSQISDQFSDCRILCLGADREMGVHRDCLLDLDGGHQEITITIEEKTSFMSSLKQGFGFTKSCELIMWHPKRLTSLLKSDEEFHRECVAAIQFASKALLVAGTAYLKQRRFDKWEANKALVRNFQSKLVLWGDWPTKLSQATPEEVTRAAAVYGDMGETATALSATKTELVNFICSNDTLYLYFSQQGLL